MAVLAEDKNRDELINTFSILEGEWELTITAMSMREDPSDVVKGTGSFRWLEPGCNLMVYRATFPDSEFPAFVAVIGFDEIAKTYVQLYTDSRNVSRILTMTLTPRLWKMERISPGFSQRFEGKISADGNTILAQLTKQEGEGDWAHDFDMRFDRRKP